MCGICFICGSFTSKEMQLKISPIMQLLENRGPDAMEVLSKSLPNKMNCMFVGTTLWLQGEQMTNQPIEDSSGNVLLWNGDILAGYQLPEDMSDTTFISNQLMELSTEGIVNFLQNIKGPWAFIYYKKSSEKLYFGRDIFGRHSLLWNLPSSESAPFLLSSVLNKNENCEEVPALGLYYIDLTTIQDLPNENKVNLIPWTSISSTEIIDLGLFPYISVCSSSMKSPIYKSLNISEPDVNLINQLKLCSTSALTDDLSEAINVNQNNVDVLLRMLTQSIQRRIDICPNKCIKCTHLINDCKHTKYAVLFSGGLDSAVIALILDKCLDPKENIDLLNVAFEQKVNKSKNKNDPNYNSTEKNYNVPDRLSGRQCWQELCHLNPDRKWNFVEIDVTAEELKVEREAVIGHLVYPLSSVLDDSIGCALWFGGRGKGTCQDEPYYSTSRVLFCGMGADEQLAGYSRHRAQFNNGGWSELISEINMEMARIYKRNLGRDNRILAHHGRAPRFPFLDEDVVSFLNSIPIYEKANLYLPRGIGEKYLLRIMAANLGLNSAASLPKRAIQFGSRIAKLENSKENGSDQCKRL